MGKRLELILKLTERCNIACSYCYYFENEDRSALRRPARLTDAAASAFVARCGEALGQGVFDRLRVIFHGGEPLLYGKRRFVELCEALRSLGNRDRIELCLQTNATVIDEEWIDIFSRHSVEVGVSIDGPAVIHDKHRVDKKGRPTHAATAAGIERLVQAGRLGRINPPSALIVMQEGASPGTVYDHVRRDLSITHMDFLLPDATWDSSLRRAWVGPYLKKLLHCWIPDADKVTLRLLKSTLSLLVGGNSLLGGFGPEPSIALTVLSDGVVCGDDFLRPCGDDVIDLSCDVHADSFMAALVRSRFRLHAMGGDALPSDCQDCAFSRTCCGGQLTHRFSKERLFNNRSVYCDELKQLYEEACRVLLDSGVPVGRIESALRGKELELRVA